MENSKKQKANMDTDIIPDMDMELSGKEILDEYIAGSGEEKYPSLGGITPIKIDIPQGKEHFNLAVISNVNVGTQTDFKPLLKKLLYHVKLISKDKDAKVILNGDLFSFVAGCPADYLDDYVKNQLKALVEIFQPIKDKIVCITSGDEENKIEKKLHYSPSHELAHQLEIEDKFAPECGLINFSLKNELTDGKVKTVSVLASHGAGMTNTFRTVVTKTQGLSRLLQGVDIYISSQSRFPMICRELVHHSVGKTNSIETKAVMLISTCGYRKFTPESVKKHIEPYYTNNYVYSIAVGRNLDYVNVKGTGQISEPKYKIYLDQLNFGYTKSLDEEYQKGLLLYTANSQLDKMVEHLVKALKDKTQEIKIENAKTIEGVIEKQRQESVLGDGK